MRVQHFENRIAIAITGGSVRFFDRHAASFGRCAQSRKRQGRSAGSLRAPDIDDTRRDMSGRPGQHGGFAVRELVVKEEVGGSEEHTSELQSLMRISYAV